MYAVDAWEGQRPAAIDEFGTVVTYDGLRVAGDLFGAVVRPRTVALVLARNTIEFVTGCVALMNNGVVPLLLDAGVDRAALARYIDRYQPEYAYLASDQRSLLPEFDDLHHEASWMLLRNRNAASSPIHDDLALLLPTSGSTGSPKLVRQSYGNVLSNGQAIVEYLGITADERPITSLPMHYTYGFSVLNSHLMAGATTLVTERSVMEKPFWSFLEAQRATSLAGVPYTYQMLKRLRFMEMDLPSVRTLTQAGGKLPPDLITEFARWAQRAGAKFFVMYGQTEATARMSYVPPDRAVEKAGSIGVPIPDGQLFLVDDGGSVIEGPDVEGELGYRGPNVCMGYAEDRLDLAGGDNNGGSLLTGDVARRDMDGYYFITGRRSRYVKVFGKRVSLDDIEHFAAEHAGEAAATSIADDHMTVWITNESHADSLRAVLAGRTGLHPSAFKVATVAQLPRTSAGKIDYQALRSAEQTPGAL